ncbi:hypothetical protein [Rhodococcus sp. T7]|uniref:hypothetical protein n=1 Tax=Rhodococcus sp. T7 TaxID=627444 RepID=UPI00135AAEC1|nr:hypothetical protein [Rhodococcus sp. T7]
MTNHLGFDADVVDTARPWPGFRNSELLAVRAARTELGRTGRGQLVGTKENSCN